MLVAGGADHYYPNFKTSLTSFDPAATNSVPSIKSLREYQLGVVFMDEYGRETPVLSNPTGTIKLAKEDGSRTSLRSSFRSEVLREPQRKVSASLRLMLLSSLNFFQVFI